MNDIIKRLKKLYKFENEKEIYRFLMVHSFLIPFLWTVYDAVKHYFPVEKLVLVLEYVKDSDNEEHEELVLFIKIKREFFSIAMNKFNAFDEEWWFENKDEAGGLMSIFLDFV